MNRTLSHAIITLFVCGDVMTGRGIDQILPQSTPPQLFEPYVRDARQYVLLAEEHSGPIPHQVDYSYVWGDALAVLRQRQPHVRIVNLETSITADGEAWPGKGIHYRMHPGNVPLLKVAGIDVATLANNHVLDWGYQGLADTLAALHQAGVRSAGAGQGRDEAASPAVMEVSRGGRVLVFAFGAESSGIPLAWAAGDTRPGVNLLPDLSEAAVERVAAQVRSVKRAGDVAVAAIHWGENWGYRVAADQRQFAHQLVDRAGIDLLVGHSSHHPLASEVYRGKLILYGCGDLVNDYEGIGGYEEFRGELGLMYFVRIDPQSGRLDGLEMVSMQMHRFQLQRASRPDTVWLQQTLSREGQRFGTRVEKQADGTLVLHWAPDGH